MLLKKYITTLCIAILCVNAHAENSSDQKERVISITRCKKVECGLILDQEKASQEEREEALEIINNFCNNELNTLSEKLKQKTPNVIITIVLLNIEEDTTSQEAPENGIEQEENTDSMVNETSDEATEGYDNTSYEK